MRDISNLLSDFSEPCEGDLIITPQGFADFWVVICTPTTLRYPQPDGSVVLMEVTRDELSEPDSYNTLKGCPVFLNHWGGEANPDTFLNREKLDKAIGVVLQVEYDTSDDSLKALLRVYATQVIQAIKDKEITAVSPSYRVKQLVRLGDGHLKQVGRTYYDVSLLMGKNPRCPDALVLIDSDDAEVLLGSNDNFTVEHSESTVMDEDKLKECLAACMSMLADMKSYCDAMKSYCDGFQAMCEDSAGDQAIADARQQGFEAGMRRSQLENAATKVGLTVQDSMSDLDLINAIAAKFNINASSPSVATVVPRKSAIKDSLEAAEESRQRMIQARTKRN